MGLFSILLLIIFIASALLMVVLVLMQDEGAEGLGGIFGGGGSSQIGNRSGNILTKATSVLGAIFLISSFGLAWLNRTPETGNVEAAARRLESQQNQGVEWWKTTDQNAESQGQSALPDAGGVSGSGQDSGTSSQGSGSTSGN